MLQRTPLLWMEQLTEQLRRSQRRKILLMPAPVLLWHTSAEPTDLSEPRSTRACSNRRMEQETPKTSGPDSADSLTRLGSPAETSESDYRTTKRKQQDK